MNKNVKKRKTKLYLLGLSVLTVATVSSLIGSTMAWFVVNRTASGTVGNIGATAEGGLEISTDGTTWGTTFTLDMATVVQDAVTGVTLTDISGDGVNFYKPLIAVAEDTTGVPSFTEVYKIAVDPTNNGKYYYDIPVQFRSKDALSVYLNEETEITSLNNNFNLAIRTAFLNSENVVTNFYTQQTEKLYYMNATTATTGATNTGGTPNTGYSDVFSPTTKVLQGSVDKRDLIATPNATNKMSNLLVKLSRSNVADEYCTGTITVRYWFEGTDANCIFDNITNSVDMKIGFDAIPDPIVS